MDKKLRARPEVVKWEKEYYIDRYTSVPEMPFEIERIHYYRRGENDTQGRFAHVLTLTVGERAVVRSKAHPERCAQINLFQSVVIPAAFGAYELLNPTGGQNTVVLLRWKKG